MGGRGAASGGSGGFRYGKPNYDEAKQQIKSLTAYRVKNYGETIRAGGSVGNIEIEQRTQFAGDWNYPGPMGYGVRTDSDGWKWHKTLAKAKKYATSLIP